jgi:hypothetical protein
MNWVLVAELIATLLHRNARTNWQHMPNLVAKIERRTSKHVMSFNREDSTYKFTFDYNGLIGLVIKLGRFTPYFCI